MIVRRLAGAALALLVGFAPAFGQATYGGGGGGGGTTCPTGQVAIGSTCTPTTGTGNVVRASSPSLVTPDAGVPSALDLTNAINLQLAAFPALGAGDTLCNATGSSAAPTDSTVSACLDQAFGATQGSILYRGGSAWALLGPGTSGNFLKTQGAGANPVWAATGSGTGCTVSGSADQTVSNNGSGGCESSATTISVAGRIGTPASTTSQAMLNLPHGAAPTSPVNGDVWSTTAGLFARINGGTVGPLGSGGGSGCSPAGSQYQVLLDNGSSGCSDVSGLGALGQVLMSNGAGAAPTYQNSPAQPAAIPTGQSSIWTMEGGTSSIASAATVQNIIGCEPMFMLQTVSVKEIGVRVQVLAASSAFVVGIYADGTFSTSTPCSGVAENCHRPTGAPLITTGSSQLPSTSTGSQFGTAQTPVTLTAGTMYWKCLTTGTNSVKFTGNAVNNIWAMTGAVASATIISGALQMAGYVSFSQAFSSTCPTSSTCTMPTFSSSSAWSEVGTANSYAPILALQVN